MKVVLFWDFCSLLFRRSLVQVAFIVLQSYHVVSNAGLRRKFVPVNVAFLRPLVLLDQQVKTMVTQRQYGMEECLV